MNKGTEFIDIAKVRKYLQYAHNYGNGFPVANVVGWTQAKQTAKLCFQATIWDELEPIVWFTILAFYKAPDEETNSFHDVQLTIRNSSGTTITPTALTRTSTIKPYKIQKKGEHDPVFHDPAEKFWEGYTEIREIFVTLDGTDLNSDKILELEFTPCALKSNLSTIANSTCPILNTLIYSNNGIGLSTAMPIFNGKITPKVVNYLAQGINALRAYNPSYSQATALYITYSGVDYSVAVCSKGDKEYSTPFYGAVEPYLEKDLGVKNNLNGFALADVFAIRKLDSKTVKVIDGVTKSSIRLKFWENVRVSTGYVFSWYSHFTAYCQNLVNVPGGVSLKILISTLPIAFITWKPKEPLLNLLLTRNGTTAGKFRTGYAVGDPVDARLLGCYASIFESSSLIYYECPLLVAENSRIPTGVVLEEVQKNPFFFQPFGRLDINSPEQFKDFVYNVGVGRKHQLRFKGLDQNETKAEY